MPPKRHFVPQNHYFISLYIHFISLNLHVVLLNHHFVTLNHHFVSLYFHFVSLHFHFVSLYFHFVTLYFHFVTLYFHFVSLYFVTCSYSIHIIFSFFHPLDIKKTKTHPFHPSLTPNTPTSNLNSIQVIYIYKPRFCIFLKIIIHFSLFIPTNN